MTASFSGYTDEQLLRLLAESNEQAFAEIYHRYWESLYMSAFAVLRLKDAAKDAVQEVFVSIWDRRATLQIITLNAFLHQAVRYQVLKAIRSEKTDQEFFKRLSFVSKDLLIHQPILFKELQTIYQQLICSLPRDQQEIFTMNREEGLTYRQIAAQKNISVKTVEKKMSLALKNIRFGLDEALGLMLVTRFLSD